MDKDEFIEQSSAYAAGALGAVERKHLRKYLETAGAEERTEVAGLVAAVSLLPLTLDRQLPPSGVKEEIIRKIRLSPDPRESVSINNERGSDGRLTHSRNWLPFGVTVAAGMVVLFSIFSWKLLNTIDEQNRGLVETQSQIVGLTDDLARKQALLDILSAKQAEMVILKGLRTVPACYGKIIWDPETRNAILQVSNLPVPPANKEYQLWTIRNKQPVSAGVFTVTTDDENHFQIVNLSIIDPRQSTTFAVTMEPKGGASQPTGEPFIAGSPGRN